MIDLGKWDTDMKKRSDKNKCESRLASIKALNILTEADKIVAGTS